MSAWFGRASGDPLRRIDLPGSTSTGRRILAKDTVFAHSDGSRDSFRRSRTPVRGVTTVSLLDGGEAPAFEEEEASCLAIVLKVGPRGRRHLPSMAEMSRASRTPERGREGPRIPIRIPFSRRWKRGGAAFYPPEPSRRADSAALLGAFPRASRLPPLGPRVRRGLPFRRGETPLGTRASFGKEGVPSSGSSSYPPPACRRAGASPSRPPRPGVSRFPSWR